MRSHSRQFAPFSRYRPGWIKFGVSLLIGSSLSIGGVAVAEEINQSDITGTNAGDFTNPSIGEGVSAELIEIDEATVAAARELAAALDDAYADCAAAQQASTTTPRRFARGRGDSVGCTPACAEVNRLMTEARSLLDRLNSQQVEELQADPSLRLW